MVLYQARLEAWFLRFSDVGPGEDSFVLSIPFGRLFYLFARRPDRDGQFF